MFCLAASILNFPAFAAQASNIDACAPTLSGVIPIERRPYCFPPYCRAATSNSRYQHLPDLARTVVNDVSSVAGLIPSSNIANQVVQYSVKLLSRNQTRQIHRLAHRTIFSIKPGFAHRSSRVMRALWYGLRISGIAYVRPNVGRILHITRPTSPTAQTGG